LDNFNQADLPILRIPVVRALLVYLLVFIAATSLLSVFVYWHWERALFEQVDSTLVWEARYFSSFNGDALAKEIDRQLARELPINFFGLFEADGTHLAGDIVDLPNAARSLGASGAVNLMIRLRERDTPVMVRVMAQAREHGNILVIARDLSDVAVLRSSILRTLIVGNGAVFGVTLLVGLLLAVRQTRRIRRVMHTVNRISRGDLRRRLADGGRDEFGRLADLVDGMLDDIERLTHEVKGACDNIAHDLRTPLGRARLHLVEYLDKPTPTTIEPVEAALADIDFTLMRFAALLRLSELEAHVSPTSVSVVLLETLVGKIGEILEPVARERSIELTYELDPVREISGDEQLLFEAIYNLVENAIKFSDYGGTVTVRTVDGPGGPSVIVRDAGPGIPASELPMVGRRFFRGRTAQGIPGSGLGLSLVLAVARMHHAHLSFTDAKPGTEVRFEFSTDVERTAGG
jgi:signal transduction histidine kinase